jgi:hypothetical protein
MKFSKSEVLDAIGDLSQLKDFPIAEVFLRSPDTEPSNPSIGGLFSEDRVVRVSDIVNTWDVRIQNAVQKGTNLFGGPDFVSNLRKMPKDTELYSLAFKNQKVLGKFWFQKEGNAPVGFVITELKLDP